MPSSVHTLRHVSQPLLIALAALLVSGVAVAQPAMPDYRDDRSTPEAVIESLYNAVERKEYVRAYSYFREGEEMQDFEAFSKGYAETATVRVKTGSGLSDGAAGSIYYTLPVAVESIASDGARTVFTGCYELKRVQPAVMVQPPFKPMGIVKGVLAKTDAPFDAAMGACPADGLD